MSLAVKAARGAVWTILSAVGGRALGVIGTLIITRFLDPDVIGEVGSAMIVVLTVNWLSPAFHAQLATIPPVGRLIRGTKELVARRINAEQKMALKSRLQGRSAAASTADVPPVRMPNAGRVVREAYRSWVSNDLAKARLGWVPSHPFALGARRTLEWMRFARLV